MSKYFFILYCLLLKKLMCNWKVSCWVEMSFFSPSNNKTKKKSHQRIFPQTKSKSCSLQIRLLQSELKIKTFLNNSKRSSSTNYLNFLLQRHFNALIFQYLYFFLFFSSNLYHVSPEYFVIVFLFYFSCV